MIRVPENPWVRDDGLDMQGLMAAFQDFWRENADMNQAPFAYREAYPHLVLQAFLQRVINGGGAVRLVVGGALTLNGAVRADGIMNAVSGKY